MVDIRRVERIVSALIGRRIDVRLKQQAKHEVTSHLKEQKRDQRLTHKSASVREIFQWFCRSYKALLKFESISIGAP